MNLPEQNIGVSIADVIGAYKADFERADREERYKWEAIGWYKAHWDIEASDFAGMFADAFSKAGNLLTAHMYYPYKMVCEYAEQDPEAVRELFRKLYNEDIPLAERYSAFREGFKKSIAIIQEKVSDGTKISNHYQDLHAVSVYLTFEYPEKYYFYKYSVYNAFKNLVGFEEDRDKVRSEVWKIENCNRMCDLVLDLVKQDSEIMEMNRARLTDECYSDPENHLLAMDIVYFGSRLKPENDSISSEDESVAYWPTPEEYSTGITKADWQKLLRDSEITKKENLAMFKGMLEIGGESTCVHLADVYGKTYSYYIGLANNFCERVKKRKNLKDCVNVDGEVKVWPVAFVGRKVAEEGNYRYSWKLREELAAALKEMDLENIKIGEEEDSATDVAKNTILFGPPGTGKTYSTVIYAVAIIEKKPLSVVSKEAYEEVLERFHKYKEDKLIETTTFHQSYGYEEFIEGIRPVMEEGEEETGDVRYRIEPGIFKGFCDDINITHSAEAEFENAWNKLTETAGQNGNSYTFTRRTGSIFVGKLIHGDRFRVEWTGGTYNDLTYTATFKQWMEPNIERKTLAGGNRWLFDARRAILDELKKNYGLGDYKEEKPRNYVFIIDEINRGNISKIFGELITLIEPSKRLGQAEEMTVKLPYSKTLFGVPDNVYLIGTMNTADRSIATIDTALRRRFRFKEMLPDADVLKDVNVEDISIRDMLIRMNKKISLLYDREHMIGHAYFMPLKKSPTIEVLAEIFRNEIIPLLQEYFYEDYEKIRLILGDNRKQDPETEFITVVHNDYTEYGDLLGESDFDSDEYNLYEINDKAFDNIEAYREI